MSKVATKTSRRAEGWLAFVARMACVLALLAPGVASAQIAHTPQELERVGVKEHLDGPLPLDTPFRDHAGAPVTLRKYFDGKRPVVLQFAYHTCPVVCSMITNQLAAGLKGVDWTIGKEFDVVTISIDPNESLERTANKRTSMVHEYGRPIPNAEAGGGWHFLVGDAASIAAVADAAGFEYQYDERQKQWGHPSVVMIVKPNGEMARYLYGLEFPSNDLRLGLLEASQGRHMTTVEQIILYCYHYDPQGGKYVLVAMRVMQVGASAVAVVLFGCLGVLWANELRKKKRAGVLSSPAGVLSSPAGASNESQDRGERAASLTDETSTSPIDLVKSQAGVDPTAVSVRGG